MTQAYPLHWPEGWPRTPPGQRQDSKYRFARPGPGHRRRFWTFADARDALYHELDQLGADQVVLSTNFKLTASGMPTDGKGRPEDQGIAVYFAFKGRPMVMARDAHLRAEENMRSLALAIEAMRQLERHGGALMMEKAFEGFEALPPPDGVTRRPWRQVFGIEPDHTVDRFNLDRIYRSLANRRHPDHGGSHEQMAELNAAYDEAMKKIKS